MQYFEELIQLLSEEQEYDRAQHEELLRRRSLNERKAQGVTWYPIAITQTEMGLGDYLTITIQKTADLQDGHKFRFGMPISLFSNYNAQEDRLNGTIAFVNRESMRIAFRVEELPEWTRRGKLGVDLLFDENSYKEMQHALKAANSLYQDNEKGELVRLLTDNNVDLPVIKKVSYSHMDLNPSQQQAVSQILGLNPINLLHGPPGTGKTTTLIHAVKALLLQQQQQILLVAPSNTAVDLLTEKLDEGGVKVVRIGNPVKVSAHLQDLTIEAKVSSHAASKDIKELEKQSRAYIDLAHKYKRNFGKAEREQRKALLDEARKIRKEIVKIQDYVTASVLDQAQVITTTLVGANHFVIKDRQYETVIIDEAAQALEPACWIPLLKGKQIILAGDHCQLPPAVKSSYKSDTGLYITLFEKLVQRFPNAVSLLNVQYRMNKEIMEFPSKFVYNDELQADSSVAQGRLLGDSQPLIFVDTAGSGFSETQEQEAISNSDEAYFVVRHLKELTNQLKEFYALDIFPSIGLIAPYRKQSLLLKELIQQDEELNDILMHIQVHTIDSFQGQEQDIIYISLTRSNDNQQIGFLSDTRRMNVAMTRARKKLIVVGDSSTIGKHLFYKGFIDYATSIDGYKSIWEWDIF